jgi:hypothetical protein
MDDFLKNARKQLEELDLQGQLKDLDLAKLKDVDLSKGRKELKKQMRQLDMQKREQDAANEGFVGGMLLGILVGAILALIFAPKTGSETREMVAGTATELKHKAEGLVGQSKEGTDEPVASSLSDEPAIEREIGETKTRPTPGVI